MVDTTDNCIGVVHDFYEIKKSENLMCICNSEGHIRIIRIIQLNFAFYDLYSYSNLIINLN